MRRRIPIALGLLLVCGLVTGCGRSAPVPSSGPFKVVAAENVWGDIAAQLAGSGAHVTSILTNPEADPHSYQPIASDAEAFTNAAVTVVNGLGYDEWAAALARSLAGRGRHDLSVQDVLSLPDGANPHRWYFPADVSAVARAISSAYGHVRPSRAAYFRARLAAFLGPGLAEYHRLIGAIRGRWRGTPVGYSESIFAGMANALGLRTAIPYQYARAISEGGEVSPADEAAVREAIARRRIAVWIYNSQNETPSVRSATELARRRGIPVVAITETIDPAGSSFQAWQVRQLRALAAALRAAHRIGAP